ncbi:743b6540-50d2-40ac-ba42-5c0247762c8f [Thermothielavioides terrestris]|uniref:743b6540-50d2-40ac-ba42-5c0247762c8f n=1 Tax=Thermothielavioides terrestris TaxID=2587410 RepID=A0A3S4B2L5_9PEZI|nr:743b6540-50d2-40ac-ba42-5c0247762c8f [Thermothielavioides terrestris]
MQANLFKLLAIAAAFSAVHSAPVETAEVTKAQVNGTQVNGTQTNDSYRVAGVRALPRLL